MGSAVGRMISPQQPHMQEFYNAINQHAFNQQLGRGASNQMYEPSPGQYDPYTASRRPNYMPFGPNQQFYQPIYRPSYDQQVRTMDQMYQMPTYTRPLTPQPMQSQYRPIPFMNQTQIDAKAAAEAASVPVPMPSFSGDGAKSGGRVHGEGIDSLLRK